MCRVPWENVIYEFILASLAVFRMPCPLNWMVLEIGGRWLYSCSFIKCCFQDLFSITRSILVQFPSSFLSICLVSVDVMYPKSRIDTTAAWKNCVLFYRIGLTSLRSITWISPLISENHHCCILTFGPAKHAIPKWCTGRKWHIPMASNRKKSRRRIWLTKWDKVKAHDTLIDWCTGRECLLNGMTVISA